MARKLIGEESSNAPEYGTQQQEPAPAKITIEVPGKPGPHPVPSDAGGEEVTIIFGAEKYAPVQYHSFDVGPFIVKTTRLPGETMTELYQRVTPALREFSQVAFKEALERFLERVRTAASAARGTR